MGAGIKRVTGACFVNREIAEARSAIVGSDRGRAAERAAARVTTNSHDYIDGADRAIAELLEHLHSHRRRDRLARRCINRLLAKTQMLSVSGNLGQGSPTS